ncbi:MAG: hypothetical protein IKL13_01835 [Clostridia bacterium]|nr:hypothetical protein [Clostridia bacterium]
MSQKRHKIEHPQQNYRRQTLIWLLLLLLILLPLCTVATYTWFAISRTPKVSDMEMTINSGVGLQIAWSADAPEEEWLQHLSFTDAIPQDTLLTPVTWSDEQGAFYTTIYGYDGRTLALDRRLSDDVDANTPDGCYVKFTLYGRTDEHMDISLAPAYTDETGSALGGTYLMGRPIWNPETISHYDGGYGSQSAVRVGLRVTKFDPVSGDREDSTFIVYEPNADIHVDGSTGFIDTPSVDGTDHLVSEDRLIRQSGSEWYERNPVVRDDPRWIVGAFQGDTFLFDLTPDRMVQIDVYIWMESLDADCVNAVTQGAQLFANLQFLAESHDQSGLHPIE